MIWALFVNMLKNQMIKKVIFNFKKIKIMIQMNLNIKETILLIVETHKTPLINPYKKILNNIKIL